MASLWSPVAPASPFTPTHSTNNSIHTPKQPYVPHPITTTSKESPNYHHQHHHHHRTNPQQPQQHVSSLPSPPLSSVHPTSSTDFFLKSPLQERCEALESELSNVRSRLQRSERSSTLREKRLSQFQQQSTDSHQSLQLLRLEHEQTRERLYETQTELEQAKLLLDSREALIQRLESEALDQGRTLKEVLVDRESLSMEMTECHADNAKFLKRLRTSTDKVERLQHENRQLIEQLRELRARVVQVSDEKLGAVESLDRERHRASQAALELEGMVARYKGEVERLQDLVLVMGNRQVQVQAQLAFFQQAQSRAEHNNKSALVPVVSADHKGALSSSTNPTSTLSLPPTITTATASQEQPLMLGDGALASILASVAHTSHSRRSKPTRRFTVNASHHEGQLTVEQRKSEFLLDQITVLQRGFDSLRQEKVTLELQLDLLQRQHQYHQQQRQKRRESQRRTLGQEQSAALSTALANMVSGAPPTAARPPSIMASLPEVQDPERERERARIQHELQQAEIRRVQQEEIERQQEKARQAQERLLAKAAADEAEKEALRLKMAKDIHLKEALASLESKRGRSDSRNVSFTTSDELKHLEHLRLAEDQPQPSSQSSRSGSTSPSSQHTSASAKANRRTMSPMMAFLPMTPCTPPGLTKSTSPTFSPSPLSSSLSSPSASSTSYFPSSAQHSPSQTTHYTQHHPSQQQQQQHQHRQLLQSYVELDIQQCSCCIGQLIEL